MPHGDPGDVLDGDRLRVVTLLLPAALCGRRRREPGIAAIS